MASKIRLVDELYTEIRGKPLKFCLGRNWIVSYLLDKKQVNNHPQYNSTYLKSYVLLCRRQNLRLDVCHAMDDTCINEASPNATQDNPIKPCWYNILTRFNDSITRGVSTSIVESY